MSGRARRRRKARAISNARSTSEIPLILVGGLAAGRRPGHAPRRGRGSAVRASGTDLTRKARSLRLQRFAPQLCRMPARRARRLRAHPSPRCGRYGLGLRDAEPATRARPESSSQIVSCNGSAPNPSAAARRNAPESREVAAGAAWSIARARRPNASARPTACRATSAPQRTSSPDGVRPGPRPSRSTGGVWCAGGNRQASSQARSRSMRGRATRSSAVPDPSCGCEHHPCQSVPGRTRDAEHA